MVASDMLKYYLKHYSMEVKPSSGGLFTLSVNDCVISDHLELQTILKRLGGFVVKSKQFNQNNITSNLRTMTLMFGVNKP